MTKVHIHVKNIAASEEKPFDLTVEGKNIGHETQLVVSKVFETDVAAPQISNSHVISVCFTIRERNVNSTQKFDLTKDGCHILLSNESGSLKIAQRRDSNFGQVVQTTTSVTSQSAPPSSPRVGFIVDPITGQKKYRSSGIASPRATTTTPSTASTTTTSTTATASTKQYTIDDLEKFGEMKQKGIISEEEFAQIKKQALGL